MIPAVNQFSPPSLLSMFICDVTVYMYYVDRFYRDTINTVVTLQSSLLLPVNDISLLLCIMYTNIYTFIYLKGTKTQKLR